MKIFNFMKNICSDVLRFLCMVLYGLLIIACIIFAYSIIMIVTLFLPIKLLVYFNLGWLGIAYIIIYILALAFGTKLFSIPKNVIKYFKSKWENS